MIHMIITLALVVDCCWNPNQNSQTSTLSGLFAGKHIVHVNDAVGCTVIDTITLNEPNPILIDLTLNMKLI